MKQDDMYFVSLMFSYGAELKGVEDQEGKKTFEFSNTVLDKVFVLCDGAVVSQALKPEDIYKAYKNRTVFYPPNFPDGRRRFLELLHADE